MLWSLQREPLDIPVESMETFRAMRSSKEVWDAFKQETTPAEFGMVEIISEVYECKSDIIQGRTEKLQSLAGSLAKRIPFGGLGLNDLTWEALHATVITIRVRIFV